jgi:Ca2+/Na+ antiporter
VNRHECINFECLTEKTFKVDALVSVLVILYNIIFVPEKTFKVDALVSVLVILYNIIFVTEKTF